MNAYGHAYPVSTIDGYTQNGLTKRELLAAMAMQALLSNPDTDDAAEFAEFAVDAVNAADALLAELERTA